jgi:hypothetical protein
MNECKFCGFKQTGSEWLSGVGDYNHHRTKGEDPEQYVECPMCTKILHIDYDINFEGNEDKVKEVEVKITAADLDQSKYKQFHLCPLCNRSINRSDYLREIFADEPEVEWLANLVTHYRHGHITSWNNCWGRHGSRYRGHWFGDYDEEKAKVNERAKRQLVRKGHKILLLNGITPDHFLRLQNTDPKTMLLVRKYLLPNHNNDIKRVLKKNKIKRHV